MLCHFDSFLTRVSQRDYSSKQLTVDVEEKSAPQARIGDSDSAADKAARLPDDRLNLLFPMADPLRRDKNKSLNALAELKRARQGGKRKLYDVRTNLTRQHVSADPDS